MSEACQGGEDHTRPLHLLLHRCGQELKKSVKKFTTEGLNLCLIARICHGVKNEVNVKLDTQSQGSRRGVTSCREVAEVILQQMKISQKAEFGMRSSAEDDSVTTAKKTFTNEVDRKTTELTSFIDRANMNQSEVGSKIPEAMSSLEEKPREMTSISVDETSEMTITYEDGIGSQRKTTSANDEETNAVTSINEAEFVMTTRMNYKGLVAGIFPGVSLKVMIDIGKDAVTETQGKDSLPTETDDGQTFHGKTYMTIEAAKDLARDHATEKVVILRPDLTITDALPPSPTGRDDRPHHMVPYGGHTVSWSEDGVYLQGVGEKKVTGQVPLGIKGVMVWGESQCEGEVVTPRHLITVADQWRTDDGETHPLLDSTWKGDEVHPEGGEEEWGEASPTECDRQGTGTKSLLATEEHHGILSVAVKENTHVTAAGLMMSHVIGTDGPEESCPRAEDRGTGRIRGVGAQDEAVAHNVTGERMSRRKYRVNWMKIAGENQMMKRKSGNMKKTWERKRIKYLDKEKENDPERLRLLHRQPSHR